MKWRLNDRRSGVAGLGRVASGESRETFCPDRGSNLQLHLVRAGGDFTTPPVASGYFYHFCIVARANFHRGGTMQPPA